MAKLPAADGNFYDVIKQYDKPLTKYKLPQQPAEIDKRLTALHEYCAGKHIAPTKAHVYAILGIDDNTYSRWINALSRQAESKQSDADNKYIVERGATLKKWQLLAESALMEIVQQADKPAGPIFTAKSVYQYREYDKDAVQEVSLGIEQFLSKMGRIRKAERSILPLEDMK